MGPKYLIDTNVIDFFNGRLTDNGRNLVLSIVPAISAITHIELFSSARISAAERVQLHRFIQVATIYDTLTPEIVQQTIAIRVQRKTKVPDAIIAATAVVYGLGLITHNTADFNAISGLELLDSYIV